MKDLREQLIDIAHAKGICSDGFKQMLQSPDIDALVKYYIANPDWCMERDFPSLSFLREHFADIGNKGIFVDKEFNGELLNERQVYIFHHCKGTIKVSLNVDKAIIPMLYFANGCNVAIKVYSLPLLARMCIPIYIFGENEITTEDDGNVEYLAYRQDIIKEMRDYDNGKNPNRRWRNPRHL